MSDEVDLAQEAEQLHREAALAASRHHLDRAVSTDCSLCGDPIPEERRKSVRCSTCIDCQREIERRK